MPRPALDQVWYDPEHDALGLVDVHVGRDFRVVVYFNPHAGWEFAAWLSAREFRTLVYVGEIS